MLVNNAGVEITSPFTGYSREELTSVVDVNLTAPMLLTHRVVPGMLERGRGHVVFISSLGGQDRPAFNEPYGATKAGLIGFNQSLRAEYRHAPSASPSSARASPPVTACTSGWSKKASAPTA